MKLVRVFAAAALTCAALAASGGVADAQQHRHMDDSGNYCITGGPDIKYEPASQYYWAIFHNACNFAIRIDFERRDPRTGAILSNYCWAHAANDSGEGRGEGRCLLLTSDGVVGWDEHP